MTRESSRLIRIFLRFSIAHSRRTPKPFAVPRLIYVTGNLFEPSPLKVAASRFSLTRMATQLIVLGYLDEIIENKRPRRGISCGLAEELAPPDHDGKADVKLLMMEASSSRSGPRAECATADAGQFIHSGPHLDDLVAITRELKSRRTRSSEGERRFSRITQSESNSGALSRQPSLRTRDWQARESCLAGRRER